MSRSGRVTAKDEHPEYIVIRCNNMEVIIKGFGQRSVDQILGNVHMDGGIPFNISNVQGIRRSRLDITEAQAEILYPPQIEKEVSFTSEDEEG